MDILPTSSTLSRIGLACLRPLQACLGHSLSGSPALLFFPKLPPHPNASKSSLHHVLIYKKKILSSSLSSCKKRKGVDSRNANLYHPFFHIKILSFQSRSSLYFSRVQNDGLCEPTPTSASTSGAAPYGLRPAGYIFFSPQGRAKKRGICGGIDEWQKIMMLFFGYGEKEFANFKIFAAKNGGKGKK
jgi:hypothetical protein